MKKVFVVIGVIVLIIALVGLGAFIHLKVNYPDVSEAPQIEVEGTPDQIVHGRYLANHVVVCMDCHSTRDWSRFAGPVEEGTWGIGGEYFGPEFGFPGTFYSKNITPHNLSGWTDGEIFRTITTGVNKDGEPLFPVMPYLYYNKMDPDDVKAIIAYIRTLEPVENHVPPSQADFPMNLIMRTIPKDYQPTEKPPKENQIAYGKYLTTISGCIECHTKQVKGEKVKGMQLAGGFEFRIPGGTVTSGNITPHNETGIGSWSEDYFVQRFKMYNTEASMNMKVKPGEFNTVMPWLMYAGMTDEDLRAIYKFLQSVEPVKNEVNKWKPAHE